MVLYGVNHHMFLSSIDTPAEINYNDTNGKPKPSSRRPSPFGRSLSGAVFIRRLLSNSKRAAVLFTASALSCSGMVVLVKGEAKRSAMMETDGV